MQKIYDKQNMKNLNKDKVSFTDFSFYPTLQYGFAQYWCY